MCESTSFSLWLLLLFEEILFLVVSFLFHSSAVEGIPGYFYQKIAYNDFLKKTKKQEFNIVTKLIAINLGEKAVNFM